MTMWQIKKSAVDPGEGAADSGTSASDQRAARNGLARADWLIDLKVRIHRQLIERINLAMLDKLSHDRIATEISQVVGDLLEQDRAALNKTERETLVGDVLDELLGLGPLEPLLKDESITDILVNGHETVFVERRGLLEPVATRFQDEKHLLRIIQKIVSAVGRRVDESSPFVDARQIGRAHV